MRGVERMPAWDGLRRRAVIALLFAFVLPTHAQTPESPAVGTLQSVRDCELRYRIHPAATPGVGPVVLIAHGFLRRGEYMAGWADAIARAGLTAVTIDLCASAAANGRHADNGADMVALRRRLGIEAAVYVGVSAGGLAAMIAASLDPDATRGVLLLDPTNAGGQARSAAARVRAPVAALVAKPQICNAWRNLDPALETLADATIVRVDSASHCDFEWPTDLFCRVACISTGSDERHRRAEARIRDVGLSFLDAIASDAPDALSRWKGEIGEAP
jgi:alpha-beta hydrolase superfamily lysophospholipase